MSDIQKPYLAYIFRIASPLNKEWPTPSPNRGWITHLFQQYDLKIEMK